MLWRSSMSILVVALGCGGGGQSPPDSAPQVLETSPIQPLLCLGGMPGDSICPINTVPLGDLGLPGARISFLFRPLMSGLMLDDIEVAAGADGLHVEHPQFVLAGEPLGDPYAGVVLDIAPDAAATLDTVTLTTDDNSGKLAIRFDAIGPVTK